MPKPLVLQGALIVPKRFIQLFNGQWGGDLWAGLMYDFMVQYDKDYWVYEDKEWRFTALPWKGSWILEGECMACLDTEDTEFDGPDENEEDVKEEEEGKIYNPNAGRAPQGYDGTSPEEGTDEDQSEEEEEDNIDVGGRASPEQLLRWRRAQKEAEAEAERLAHEWVYGTAEQRQQRWARSEVESEPENMAHAVVDGVAEVEADEAHAEAEAEVDADVQAEVEDPACYDVFAHDDTAEGIRQHGENEGEAARIDAVEVGVKAGVGAEAEVEAGEKVPEWVYGMGINSDSSIKPHIPHMTIEDRNGLHDKILAGLRKRNAEDAAEADRLKRCKATA